MNFASNNETSSITEINKILDTQDFGCVFDMIIKNPALIYSTFECILDRLKSSKSDEKFRHFCFDVFENFVLSYKIPVVLWINNPDIVKILKEFAEISHIHKNRVNILAESCLSLFSFDKDIQNIANLWRNLNPDSKNFPSGPEPSGFAKLYQKKQEIIKDSEDLLTISPQRKKELPQKIEQFLKTENFENPKFNYLEQAFGIYYYNELAKILDAFETPTTSNNDKFDEIHQAYPDSPSKLSKVPNHLRTSFILHERLYEDENVFTEYKGFGLPFNETTDTQLKKAICAFLNRYGGRLYIGVDDHKNVVGIKLQPKDRDTVKTSILCLLKDFEPNIRTSELVKVNIIPIRSPANHKIIPGLFVIKIIVQPGDPKVLYSASQSICKFYIRNDGQSVALTPREVTNAIIQRREAPEERKISKEFNDPEPEAIVDVEPNGFQNNHQNNNKYIRKEEKLNATKFINRSFNFPSSNKTSTVFIQGLPSGIPVAEAEQILRFQEFVTNVKSSRIFYSKGLVDSGDAYVNFSDEYTAKLYADLFDGLLVGENIIKTTLK